MLGAVMTMKTLYQAVTGDTAAHQRAIDGKVRKLDARRLHILRARVDGQSLRQIGDALGVSVGSVQSAIDGAMRRVHRELHQLPRYSVSRKGMGGHRATAG